MSYFSRTTKETDIAMTLTLTAKPGQLEGGTGIGFFDHMLTALCHYGQLDINLTLRGDWQVDQHHSLEDLGYVLGSCFRLALEETPDCRRQRFASSYVPMDESLARVVVDLSGRPFLYFQTPPLRDLIGQLESDAIREFLRAFTDAARITCHMEVLYGTNSHHMVEALFKALGLGLRDALRPLEQGGQVNSTKGSVQVSQKEVL